MDNMTFIINGSTKMLGVENPFFDYDKVIADICQNVDDRIKFLAIFLPIVWMGGNWLYNKSHDNKFIQKHFSTKSIPAVWPNLPYTLKGKKKEGEDWFVVEMMSGRDIILEIVVPCFRIALLFGMGFLIYYTQTAGMG